MKVLKVRLSGLTASFRLPFAYTGVQLCLPCPTYGMILGLTSCCAGRLITPNDTAIGFEYSRESTSQDLERFIRWDYNPGTPGKPKLNPKGPGIRKREFHIHPELTIYLTNLTLESAFRFPKGIPTLGRSQDIACIEEVDQIEVTPVPSGEVGGTIIPLEVTMDQPVNGFIIRVPEFMTYDEKERLRKAKNLRVYVATTTEKGRRTPVSLAEGLYSSTVFVEQSHCIYLYKWLGA